MEHHGAGMDVTKSRKMLRERKRKGRLETGRGYLPYWRPALWLATQARITMDDDDSRNRSLKASAVTDQLPPSVSFVFKA
jgi:hypothetical protein